MPYNDQAATNIFVTSGHVRVTVAYACQCSKRYDHVTVENKCYAVKDIIVLQWKKNAVQCPIAIVHGGIYLSLSI